MSDPIVSNPDSTDNLKRCYRCSELKRHSEFALDRSKPDGRQIWCKACKREYRAENREAHKARDRQYYADHREERLARIRLYRAEHREEDVERSRRYRAEHRDELNAYDRQRRVEHGDLYRARRQRYNAVHSEQNVERMRRWRLANPEKRKPHDHRARARRAGAGGSYTSSDLTAIRAAQTDKRGRLICWACGKPIIGNEPPPHMPNAPHMPPHLDHWIPLDKQGTNSAGNLHYMHAVCNLKKGAKHPTDIGRLI